MIITDEVVERACIVSYNVCMTQLTHISFLLPNGWENESEEYRQNERACMRAALEAVING